MKKLICIVLLISSLCYSQTEKKVGDFHKVTAFDQIEVELIPSNDTKVLLSGINSDEVEVVNKNGELKLRMPLTKLLKGNLVKAKVYYVEIDAIEANEGAQISNEATLKGTAFDIIAKEGARVDIQLEVARLTTKIVSGASVTTQGVAKNQDITMSAGSVYNGKNLHTEQTVISMNAGGEAEVFATELIDVKVRAGGDILIYGNPKNMRKKTFAGGRIKVVQ